MLIPLRVRASMLAGLLVIAGLAQAAPLPPPSASDARIVAAFFEPAEVERGRTLGSHRAMCFLAGQALALAVLAGLAYSGPGRRAAERLRARFTAWPRAGLAAESLLVGGAMVLAGLPLAYYRGFVLEHQLGLSTQTAPGWLSDRVLESAIGYAVLVVCVLAAHALQAWSPRRWWVWSWVGLTAGIFVFFYLHPLLIAPLFNSYRPLERGPLRDGCTRIAREAGIPITDVFVMDASRRTRRFNATFTGVGSSRTIALHDTLVDGLPVAGTLAVVGHEAGHWVHHHMMRGMCIASVLILVFLAVASRPALLGEWPLVRAGALARVGFLVVMFQLAVLPLESTLSRGMETQADEEALRLARDPRAMVTMLVALARSNVSNLLPHPVVKVCLHSHPAIPERIRAALEAEARSPAPAAN